LAVGYRRLAERALERVRRLIGYIGGKMKACNTRDVYSTVKTVEDILRFFPREQYEAAAGLDRLCHYAQAMNFQVKPMEQAVEMVRSYLSRSLPVLEEERQRRQQERIGKEKPPVSVDFSTVNFSLEDLERIEIPPHLSRFEDQTLAYCARYWNLIDDASFERILFLYSRKYRTKNYTVYMVIRQGRRAGRRDEEILSSVMSLLVTGYYYSILGDRYLQRQWQTIKLDMEKASPAAKPARQKSASAAESAAGQEPAAAEPVKPVRSAKPAKPVKSAPAAAKPAKPAAGQKSAAAAAKPASAKPAAGSAVPAEFAAGQVPAAAEPVKPAPAVSDPAVPAVPPAKPVPVKAAVPARETPVPAKRFRPLGKAAAPVSVPPAEGSVSDRLRKLSGRSYDLYQDRFLAQVRPAIRKVLGAGRGLFFTLPEKVEDLVYGYLREHYADPYMNWAESDERRQLAEQGFKLSSLNPVIDECFKRIK
jgi:hypothetical protein